MERSQRYVRENDGIRKKGAQKMSSREDYRDFILKKLDERTLLEQLAEEASELSQAALKLIRAKGLNNNVTPKTEYEAIQNIVEEMRDRSIVITLLCYKDKKLLAAIFNSEDVENSPKWKRWAERLGYKEEQK